MLPKNKKTKQNTKTVRKIWYVTFQHANFQSTNHVTTIVIESNSMCHALKHPTTVVTNYRGPALKTTARRWKRDVSFLCVCVF